MVLGQTIYSSDPHSYLLLHHTVERASELELENIQLRRIIDEKDDLLELAVQYIEGMQDG